MDVSADGQATGPASSVFEANDHAYLPDNRIHTYVTAFTLRLRPDQGPRISVGYAHGTRRNRNYDPLLQTRLAVAHRGRKDALCRSRKCECGLRLVAEGRRGADHPLALRPSGHCGRRSDPDTRHGDRLRPDIGRSFRDELPYDASGERGHTARLRKGRSRGSIQHLAGTSPVPSEGPRGLRLCSDNRRYAHLHCRRYGADPGDEDAEKHRHRLPAGEPALYDDC